MLQVLARIGAAVLARGLSHVALPLSYATIALVKYSRSVPAVELLPCGCKGKLRLRWPAGPLAVAYLGMMCVGAAASLAIAKHEQVVGYLLLALHLVALPMAVRDVRRMKVTYRACSCPAWHDDNFCGGARA